MAEVFDIYTRVSDVGGREGDSYGSPEIQEAVCREWADRHGVIVGEVVLEENVSGAAAPEERQLDLLLQRCESGESDGILVRHLDRFGRDVISGALAYRRLRMAGKRLVAVADGLDSNAPGAKLQFDIRMAIAEDYLDRVKANFQQSIQRAAERGVYMASKPPLGYLRNDQVNPTYINGKLVKDGTLVVDPVAGPLVQEAFRLRAEGANAPELIALFAEKGIKISRSGLGALLERRAYLGEATAQTGRKGKPRVIKNNHTPLITEDLYERAQATRGTYHPRNGTVAENTPLAGLVYCATCGSRCRGAAYGKPDNRQPNYVCTNPACSKHAAMNARKLDEYVEAVLQDAALDRNPYIAAVLEGDDRYQRGLDAVDEARQELEQFRDNPKLITLLGMDGFEAGLQARKAALDLARRQLSEIRPPERRKPKASKATSLDAFLMNDGRREVFHRFVSKVILHPAGRVGSKVPKASERVEVLFVGQPDDDE